MIQPSKDKSKLLYDAVSKDYSIGTYDEFKEKLQSPEKRKAFYNGVGSEYSLGTYEEFESKIVSVKKKEPSQPISPEKVWGSKSQQKNAYDILGTEKLKQAGVSATSTGKTNVLSPAQEEAKLKKELASIKVTPENMDLVSAKTDRLSALQKSSAKAVKQKQAKVDEEITAKIFTTNKEAINQAIASEENDYEISDYAREAGKKVLNIGGGILNIFPKTVNALSGNTLSLPSIDKFEKKVPFGEQLKEVDAETDEIKKQDPNFVITNEQRLELAKQKFALKAEKQQHLDNASRILQDESPEVQARIKAKSINDIKNTSQTSKSISAQIQVLNNQATPIRSELAKMEKTAKSGNYNDQFVLEYNTKLKDYNKIVDQYTSLLKDKEKVDKDNLTAQERLEVFKLDYDPYVKATDDIIGGFAKMGGDFLYTMGKLDEKLNEIPGVQDFNDKYSIGNKREDGKNIFMAGAEVLLKDAENRQSAHRQIKVSDIDGFGKLGGWVGQTLGAIAPFAIGSAIGSTEASLASKAFLPMSPALVGFSTAAAGGAMRDMDIEMQNTPGLEYSNLQYLTKTAGSVASNALMFGNYGAIFKNNKALFESIGKTPGANIEFQKGIKDYASDLLKTAKGVNKTGSTMALVSGINMYIDNHVLGKKHENDFEEIADSWLEGAAMHSFTAEMPKIVVYMTEKVIPNSTKKEMRSNLSDINVFATELRNNKNLLPEEIAEIKSKIKFIEDKNEKIFRKSLKDSSSFTPKQIAELLRADQDKFAITKEAESIKKGNYSKEYKQKELDRLKTEFNKITAKTNDVFTNKYNSFDSLEEKEQERLKGDAEEELQKELNPNREKELKLTQEQIKEKALQIHKTEQIFNGMNIKDIDSLKRTAMAEIAQGLTDKQKQEGYKITNSEVVEKVIKDWNQRVADRMAEKEKKETVDSEPTPTEPTVNEKELGIAEEPKIQGTPDVISEPIDLEVPKPKVEATKEEAKAEEEVKVEEEPKEEYKLTKEQEKAKKDLSVQFNKLNKKYLDVDKKMSKANEEDASKMSIELEDIQSKMSEISTKLEDIEKPITPTEEVKPIEVVEPKKVDTSKIDEEIDFYQEQVDYSNSKIYDIEDEIVNEKGNTKSGLIELREQVKKEIEEVKKDKSLSRDERLDKIEEIKYKIENFKEEQQDLIDSYKDDLQAEKADLKQNQRKLDKFIEKKRVLLEQETAPVETKKEQLTKGVEETSKALQDAYNAFKTTGFALDPKKKAEQDLQKQAALNKALIDYGVAKLKKGTYEFSEFVKDLAEEGINVSKEFAKGVYEKIKSAHAAISKKESGERLGIKRTPAEEKAIQDRIDKAYELGAKEQRAISREVEKTLRTETKETEAQAKDALAAQREVLGIEKKEALSEQGAKFRQEKESIKQSIKDKIAKSKDAIKNINQIVAESFDLNKLDTRQVKSILNNAMKIFTYTNVENGISNFIDHVDKVINNIDHVRNLENLETLRKKSFQNLLKAKVDFSESVTDVVSKVLSIKPENVPSDVMTDYSKILEKLGDNADKRIQKLISEIPSLEGAELLKKQGELKELRENQIKDKAELIQMANNVIDAFQANRNKVIELSDAYNSYIENNELQEETFSKIIKKMEADDIITEAEADLMRKNSDYYVERKSREGKKSVDLEQRESLTERVNQTLDSLNSPESVEYRKNSLDRESILEANKVVGKVSKEYLDSLSDNELETVLNELNALDGGFVTSNLRKVANGIELFEREKAITPILSDAKFKWWEGTKSTIKAAYYGMRGDKVQSSVWYNKLQGAHNNIIDTVVNNIKNNDLYKNTSDKAAKLWGQSKTYIEINQNKYINPLSNLIEKQSKGDSAEVMKSNIKTSLYLYQKMHNSSLNKGKDIHVEEYVNTANKNKVYSEDTLNEINSALDKFREKDFDVDRWYNEELTDSERKVVDGIRKFYDSDIKDKAKSTSYFDDGRLIDTSNPDYIPVDFAFADNTDVQIDNLIKNKTEAFYNPSVKAGNLMDKVGSSGGMNKSLNLTNPFKTMETYLTDVSTQYHMMNEVRIQNQLYKKLLANKSFSKSSLELISAMKSGNDKALNSWLENAYKETGFWGSVFDKRITKQLLSGFGKFAAEGVGNAINMTNHINEVNVGIKIMNDSSLSIEKMDNAMYNLGISQAYRFIGKAIDIESPFKNQGGVDMPLTRKLKVDSNMPNQYINMMNNLYKRTKTKAVLDQIEMLHDALRVTPDKSLSKPLALGIFQKRFQSLSGELPNWEKISSGDAEYMEQNKDFIDVAVSSANVEASLVIGSQNPYEKAGKQLITKDSNAYSKANGFFQGYSMAQGSAFQVALKNLLYNGAISKVEASIMIAQRISSQAAYLTISKGIQKGFLVLGGSALGLTLFKDDEEEEGNIKRNIVASAVQLGMSRTGAVGSNLAAFAFEKGSEQYGQGLLYEGEYTKGKSTMFSAYDPKKTAGENFLNVGLQSMGQRWVTVSKGKEVVTDFAKGEWKTGIFDVAGSLGYIPLYKDINAVVGGIKYQGIPSKEMTKDMTSSEQIELEEKKIPKVLETTFKNLGIAKKKFLNKEISKDEWHKIRDKNKKVYQSVLDLGPIEESVFESSIDKMVESIDLRSGKYEGIEDFKKMNANERKEYLYNVVKDVKKGEKIPQDVKDKVGKIIKSGLIKESEVGDVVRYYQKYK